MDLNNDRRSIRLRGYDYSQSGAYFVTIVTQDRERFFGEVSQDSCIANSAGAMIEKWWTELAQKFPMIELDYFCVMPNHIHAIIVIVGADLRVCPPRLGAHAGAPLQGINNDLALSGAHAGAPLQKKDVALSDIVQWFKTMTTNEYIRGVKHKGWVPFRGKLWQRNYYEHIIRNEDELDRIREYIMRNPINWSLDEENPGRIQDSKGIA